jgi:ribose 1,5-bisphosphokinase
MSGSGVPGSGIPTSGRLIAVVGPSGVGKDTVMAALCAARPGLACARRVITRPSGAGSEDFDGVTPTEFARQRDQGAFALFWSAHDLEYGVPATICADLAAGRDVLVNLSRAVLGQAAEAFPGMVVVSLTARPEVLAARLVARGRESGADIARRLARAGALALPAGLTVIEVDNSGDLAETIGAALAALYPVRAAR